MLLICSFALRLAPLGRYVTPDEPAWVYRSIRFADALTARDWTAIPSTGHPGVTTMWLGAAGVTIQRWLAPEESAAHLDWIRHLAWLAPENGQAFRRLAVFLPWGRAAVALAATLGLAILYPLLARLFHRRVALLAVGLLAFDPFLTGHSGLLHTDALLATFCLLALAAALNGMQEQRPTWWATCTWWALSGLFTGLALLTKTPAIILPPLILLLCALSAIRHSSFAIRHSPFAIRNSLLFIISLFITMFALYPALWANPADTLTTLSSFAGKHVGMAQRPIFFAGQTTYDPGLAFYPVVLLFRISPLVLIGLIISIITLRRLPADRRLACLLMLAFAVGFGALMSLGAKKHDRYLLPALPPLALVAALGWEYASRQVASRQVMLVLIQLGLTLPFALYPLTGFNLLAGGPWVAARVLSTDWGEGMGAAARRLNQRPDADQLTVAALSVPTFASIFDGHTIPLDQATQADYIVHAHTPTPPYPVAHTTRLSFLDHAVILTNTIPFEQAAYLADHTAPNDLILLDADTPLLRTYTGPGTPVSVADLPNQAAIIARLAELDAAGHPNLWLIADPAAAPITAAHLRQTLNAIADPISSATVASTTITQYEIRDTQSAIRPDRSGRRSQFADFRQITLIDALLPDTPVNTPFPILLRWQIPAPAPTGLHASLRLRDASAHLWAEVGQPVLNHVTFPTSAWTPGEWNDTTLTLKPPNHIPPDTYTLELTVTDNRGAQLGAWDAGGQFQGVSVPLGSVEIAPPAKPFPYSLCEDELVLIAGPLQTCAPNPPPDQNNPAHTIPSGDTLTLALTWSATAPPETDYRVRWRLLDAGHSTALEQIAALSPYPTSHWRAGDSFESRYDLRLDPALPAARYTLALNILAPDGHPLWAEDETLSSIEILPRDRSFELPDNIAHPLRLALGDAVHLRGFDLDRTQAAPDDTLSLTLYWQADGPTDLDYTVFVHLVGPDGQPHGQTDQFPGAGAAPTTSWALGQVIVDPINLPVDPDAPAGAYHIAIGLYDAASGGRMPIRDNSGNPLPNDQIILPLEITIAGASQ